MNSYIFDGTYTDPEFEINDEMYSITLDDIKFAVTPGCRGSRNSMGVPEEPDYPPEFEFLEAETVEILKYYYDSGETFPIPSNMKEFKCVLKEFLNQNESQIEIYIAENQ